MKINGYNYQFDIQGHGQPTWLFLHGFLGSQADFAKIVPRGTKIYLTTYGFGKNDPQLPAENFKVEHQVQDLADLLTKLEFNHINLVGYSMGARLALAFALQHPNLVKQLWLESGTAGIIEVKERQARQQADQRRADKIEQAGLPEFVKQWEKLPLFASQNQVSPQQQQFMHQQRINHQPNNMANSLRYFGTGMMPTYWAQLKHLTLPTTLITGAEDDKFTHLNQKMQLQLPHARHLVIPRAGHNVHFEKGAIFTDLLNQEATHEN